MNPDHLKGMKVLTDMLRKEGSLYGFGGLDTFLEGKDINEMINEIIEKDVESSKEKQLKSTSKENAEKKEKKEQGTKEMNKKSSTIKQEHAWKLRERRYRAWATQNGEGKMIESNEFNFLSEFFQHLEEEYDFYDLMDGVCVNEVENLWLFEGDIVNVVGGEYYQGYHEFNVTGVFDCRGTSYCLVDFQNVLHLIEDMSLAESFEVLGHAYDKKTLSVQESFACFQQGEDDDEEISLTSD